MPRRTSLRAMTDSRCVGSTLALMPPRKSSAAPAISAPRTTASESASAMESVFTFHSPGASAGQELLDPAAFLHARPVDLPDVAEGHRAVRADEEARRQRLDSPRSGGARIAVEQQRKAQAEILRRVPCRARAAAHLHRQDYERPARERGSQPLDAGQLVAA